MMTDEIDVGAEARRIYEELKSYGERVQLYGEPAEMNTYFRVSTNLLEKLLEFQERAHRVHQVREFTDKVLQIMEDLMSPDQRTEFMDRLEM